MSAHVRIRVSMVAAAAIGCVHSACAQQPIGVTAPPRPTKFAIPAVTDLQPSRFRLPNGLRVLVVNDTRAPLFETRLVIGSGWRAETSSEPGTSVLVRESVTGGAMGVSANRLDSLGILFAATASGTDAEGLTTGFRMSGPSPSLEPALALLSAAVRQPDMSASALDRRRQRFIERRRRLLYDPLTLATEHARRLLRPPSWRSNAAPSDSALSSRTPEQVRRFHDANYVPQNTILVIVAPQSVDEVRRIASVQFGTWEGGPRTARVASTVRPPATGHLETVLRPGSTQGTISVGIQMGEQESRAFRAGLLLRLVTLRRLNEELAVKGWTYNVSGVGAPGVPMGDFVFRTSITPGRTGEALSTITSELARLAANPPDSAEIDLALRIVSAGLARASESRDIVADRLATAEMLGLPRDYWAALQRTFTTLRGTDLQRVAHRAFAPSALTIVVVGDSSVLRSVAPVISP
jgi:zinc protease